MSFKDELACMLNDLSCHKRDRKMLLNNYIQERLNTSLANYYKEMLSSFNDLTYRDDRQVLKYLEKD